MSDSLIGQLPAGPLDIVGDVHGEIDVLNELLAQLGYDPDGGHPDGRRLVFIGDLVDRGPDSPAVLDRVARLVADAGAQCILGNHELNLLRDVEKHGNSWWVHPDKPMPHPAARISAADKARFTVFLESLPLVLERADLRVVHACWNQSAVARVRAAESDGHSALDLYQGFATDIKNKWSGSDTLAAYGEEWREHHKNLTDRNWQPVLLEAVGCIDADWQMANPVAVLTSGEERPARQPIWAGNRWRMVERVKWWDSYNDSVPVVVGHYWRRHSAASKRLMDAHGPDLFANVAPHRWMGARNNVYCIDFSIGGRYVERAAGAAEFHCRLAALRVPEWQILHHDGETWSIGAPG
ncbi:MAG: metallophosphoesterase [Gammaproteobacteria bacterium]|nr:metallophosphoesterase [Gammaproteobacteria bacterium]